MSTLHICTGNNIPKQGVLYSRKASDAFSIFLVSCFSAGGGAISNGIQPTITHLYGNNLKSGKYRIPLKFYFCRCILPPKSNSPFPADEETDSISGSHNLTSPSLDRTSHSNSLKGPRLLFAAERYDHMGVLLLIFVQQASVVFWDQRLC